MAANEDIQIRIKTAIDASESAQTIGEFKKSLRELKSLGLEVGDTNSEAFQEVNKAIGDANDKLGDMNAAFKSMSGEPIDNVKNSFNNLKSSMMSLDLKGAKTAFNNLTTSLVDMGKAILANPIMLLGAVVAAIVVGLYQLKDAGGAVTKIFDVLGSAINGIIQTLKDLGDEFGLTAFAAQEAATKMIASQEAVIKTLERDGQHQIDMAKARGEETYDLELEFTEKRLEANRKLSSDLSVLYAKQGNKFIDDQKEVFTKALDLEIKFGNDLRVMKAARKTKEANDLKDERKKSEAAYKELLKKRKEREKKELEDSQQAMENERIVRKFQLDQQKDTLDKRLSMLDLSTEKEEEILRKAGVTELEITLWRNSQVKSATDAFYAEQLKAKQDIEKKLLEASQASIDKERNDRGIKIEMEKDSLDKRLRMFDLESEAKEQSMRDAAVAEIDIVKWRNDEIAKITEEFQKSEYDKSLAEAESKIEMVAMVVEKVEGLWNAISGLLDVVDQNRLDSIEAEKQATISKYDAEIQKAQENGQNTSALQKKRDMEVAVSEKKQLDIRNSMAKRAFITNKALGIVNAGISTAMAVVAALAAGSAMGPAGVVMGPLMAALAAATGVAQIAAIAAKKFTPEQPASSGGVTANIPSVSMPSSSQMSSAQEFKAPDFFGLGKDNLMVGGGMDNRVYVVESDITNTQNKVKTIQNRANLGM